MTTFPSAALTSATSAAWSGGLLLLPLPLVLLPLLPLPPLPLLLPLLPPLPLPLLPLLPLPLPLPLLPLPLLPLDPRTASRRRRNSAMFGVRTRWSHPRTKSGRSATRNMPSASITMGNVKARAALMTSAAIRSTAGCLPRPGPMRSA
jgi:hypothetical protein